MRKKSKKKYAPSYQTGGDEIRLRNLINFQPTDPTPPGQSIEEVEKANFRKLYEQTFAPKLTPEQLRQQSLQEATTKGIIDAPPEPEQDVYDQYGYGDPTLQPRQRTDFSDFSNVRLNPLYGLARGVAQGVTAIASGVNNRRTNRDEMQQYLKSLQPTAWENMERYGLNPGPIYSKYGGATKYQTGGQATRADSLAVYNNTQALQNYYKNYNYRPGSFDGRVLNSTQKHYVFNDLDLALDRYRQGIKEGVTQTYPTANGKIREAKRLPENYYRKNIDANRFMQREETVGAMDTRAPMALYDRRIAPDYKYNRQNINPDNDMYLDIVEYYGYEPFMVKPYDLLTPTEKTQRENRIKELGLSKPKQTRGKDKLGEFTTSDDPKPLTIREINANPTQIQGTIPTGQANVQGNGYTPLTIRQKPTNYSITYPDYQSGINQQRSAYFPDYEAWQAAGQSVQGLMQGRSEAGDRSRASMLLSNNPTMKTGGLSRSEDYGSKKKPYPSVKSKDFAGGGRSYPIPTKADAIDALRLAGLHGRSDVRAKVYKKYPELKKRQTGGVSDDYYASSAALAHYKGLLNEKLKAKNPQGFTDYFKPLVDLRRSGQSTAANKYVQESQYNEYLSPEEVKATLGDTDYEKYIKSLQNVNNYNIQQGQQPLYGQVEGEDDVTKLNYGRRFASLQVTPSFSTFNQTRGTNYSREYSYDPTKRNVNIQETGDTTLRPASLRPVPTLAFQTGGETIQQTRGLPSNVRDLANVEAERGEAYMDFAGEVYQVDDKGKTHEQGGEFIPQVHKVLENTSDLRKDRNSKFLKVDPKQFKALTGLDTKSSSSHAKALIKANEQFDKQRENIVKKIQLASENKQDMDKLAENSTKLNLDHFAAIPTKQQLFDRLFEHQEAVKVAANIPTGTTSKYGGYRYQNGGSMLSVPSRATKSNTSGRSFVNTASQFLPFYEQYLDINDMTEGATTGNMEQFKRGTIGLIQPFAGKAVGSALDYLTEKFVNKETADKNEAKREGILNMGEADRIKLFQKYGLGGYDKWVKDGKPPLKTGGRSKFQYQTGGITPYSGSRQKLKTPAGNPDSFPANTQFDDYIKDLTAKGFKFEGLNSPRDLQEALYNYKLEKGELDDIRKMWGEGMHLTGMKRAREMGFVDDKGLFKPGVLDDPNNLRKLASLYPDNMLGPRIMRLANNKKPPRIWTEEPTTPPAQQPPGTRVDTSIRPPNLVRNPQSSFHEPLRWFDVASPINTYLAALERIPEKYNPAQFNQLRYKLLDPTAALQQNQADFNASVNAVQNASGAGVGSQMANIANLAASKYALNNQVIGNYENQNAQIKNQEILYNTQVRDKQSVADQQAREVFEDKVLTSKAKQQEQKLTALDSLYKTIAENRALNRNGNLIMKFSRAFDQYGNYNGYQTQFQPNPQLGIPATPQTGKFQPAGGVQQLNPGKSYYNRRTGKTFYFDGSSLLERG